MTRVAVVDYGAGNLVSIAHALSRVGADVTVADRPALLDGVDAIVVPGVGASGPAMQRLRRRGLAGALERRIGAGVAYLGICLGMQLLFDGSDEDGATGLGWLAGRVRAIPGAPRLPHIGWNLVEPMGRLPLLPGAPRAFYFVHSYAAVPDDPAVVVARTTHGGTFASAVAQDRVVGVQFHPEKSADDGLAFLASFVRAATGSGALVAIEAGSEPGRSAAVGPGRATAASGSRRHPAIRRAGSARA